MSKRRKPPLSPEDQAIWDSFTKGIKPLEGNRKATTGATRGPSVKPTVRQRSSANLASFEEATAAAFPPKPQEKPTLDRRQARRLRRGQTPIDRKIDLHGMTQDQAFAVLGRAVRQAHDRGERCLLVVTGKGGKRWRQTGGDMPVEMRRFRDFDTGSGVLKRMVPLWLSGPHLGALVQSYSSAGDSHGGEGALYVMIRRKRSA